MSPAEIFSAAVVVLAACAHAAVIYERVRQLREDHNELHRYAHNLGHEVIEKISEKLDELQRQILAITPRDQWPK